MAKRYLSWLYFKNFFVILFSLVLFFVGLDFLQVFRKLPDSANLQVLYVLYQMLRGIDILMPVSLVFAMISLKVYLIKSNELVALYALGYSKRGILKPIFFTSLLLTLLYLFLHFTSFTYAQEYADNIKKYNSLMSATKNLFFKYNNSYVYFERLIPLKKVAYGVRIFETNGTKVQKIVIAKEADFILDHWHIKNATIIKDLGRRIETATKSLDSLYGYVPKILDSVYEGKTNISLMDAIYALELFKKQKIDLGRIEAVIFYNIFYPFFAPILMIIIFYFVPISARFFSLNLFSFGAVIATLIVWGVLFVLAKLAFSGTLSAEVAILGPIATLFVIALLFYKRF